METYLKLASVRNDKTCNCISPFYINDITGINPNTGREYSSEDINIIKTALYRISAAKGCNVTTCCDPNDPTAMPDAAFTKQFTQKYPKIMPMYEGSQLISIKLSTTKDVKESGWQDPLPYFICKITKATIQPTSEPTIFRAVNLVNDCYNDSCNSAETITINNLLQNSSADMKYTTVDDARVTQAILEGNISYVKEYVRKYKQVDIPLTNDDYRNRMIHLAAGTKYNDILTMLIALKANLKIQNKLGETPIHFAVRGRNLDNIATLLSQGVDLTIPTTKGETPMFYAMATGDMRVVNMLYTNNSPVLGVDALGNNLIHYCIQNCPSYKENDSTVPNTKSEIIQWLIEHGVSTEQKNNAGITPLELTSRQINREINRECAMGIQAEQADVVEKFFGGGSNIRNKNNRRTAQQEHFSNPSSGTSGTSGASEQDLSEYTPEHLSLLDIQTKLFNNIIRNNPSKYGGYINVTEIPKGAPIEVLDTVCVGGSGITGNEDSDECLAKGGQIVKIKNKTTKIKLELIPEEQSVTDTVSQRELYYNKDPKRIPKNTVPSILQDYNSSVMKAPIKSTPQLTPQTTVGMTYPIATGSNNLLQTLEDKIGLSSTETTHPQTTMALSNSTSSQATAPMITASLPTDLNTTPSATHSTTTAKANALSTDEHPSILDENNAIVSKCRRDAMRNSEKMQKTATTIQNTTSSAEIPTTTITAPLSQEITKVIYEYRSSFYGLLVIVLLAILGFIGYKWFVPASNLSLSASSS
jgi:ankyrin repeat protein